VTVVVPKELLRELVLELSKVEEVLATLEELLNEEGLRRVREAEEEYRKEDYIVVESGKEVEKLLEWAAAVPCRAALTRSFLRELRKLPDDVKSRALKSSSLTLIKLANPVLLLAYVLTGKST